MAKYAADRVPPPTAPKEVGVYSMDPSRQYHGDRRSLKVFREPTVGVDLNEGFHPEILRNRDTREPERLKFLLTWIQANKAAAALDKHHIVSYRGTITRLMCCPYENKAPLRVACCRRGKVVYLCEYDTPETTERKARATDEHLKFMYGGYRFEAYASKPAAQAEAPASRRYDGLDPSGDAGPDAAGPGGHKGTAEDAAEAGGDAATERSPAVCLNEEFCSVVTTKLGGFRLLLAGEVDCKCPRKGSYMELKTTGMITHEGQQRSFKRFKILKWWCQSYLLNVPRIVCGFRDTQHQLRAVKKFHTLELPKQADGFWVRRAARL